MEYSPAQHRLIEIITSPYVESVRDSDRYARILRVLSSGDQLFDQTMASLRYSDPEERLELAKGVVLRYIDSLKNANLEYLDRPIKKEIDARLDQIAHDVSQKEDEELSQQG